MAVTARAAGAATRSGCHVREPWGGITHPALPDTPIPSLVGTRGGGDPPAPRERRASHATAPRPRSFHTRRSLRPTQPYLAWRVQSPSLPLCPAAPWAQCHGASANRGHRRVTRGTESIPAPRARTRSPPSPKRATVPPFAFLHYRRGKLRHGEASPTPPCHPHLQPERCCRARTDPGITPGRRPSPGTSGRAPAPVIAAPVPSASWTPARGALGGGGRGSPLAARTPPPCPL